GADSMSDNKPLLVDAIIGNSKLLASLGRTGRMYRLWWPNIDTPQHIDAMRTGLQWADNPVTWFDEAADGWQHEIAYVDRTNIVRVDASSSTNPIEVASLHFAVPKHDFIVREYTFTNTSAAPTSFSFIVHSSFLI